MIFSPKPSCYPWVMRSPTEQERGELFASALFGRGWGRRLVARGIVVVESVQDPLPLNQQTRRDQRSSFSRSWSSVEGELPYVSKAPTPAKSPVEVG